jgi:two-component system LytT family response regulator
MDTLKLLIVDDEQDCREVLCELIGRYFPAIEIAGMAAGAEEAFVLINKTAPDLVLLDIQMPPENGFSLLKRFEKVPFDVIFVTSHDEFALTAIKFNALDYLLKPIDIQELQQAITKALSSRRAAPEQHAQIINLLDQIEGDKKERRLAVHHGEKVKLLQEKDIVFVEAESRYCKIRMANTEQYVIARNLGEFEEYFGESSPFIRISKTYIINAAYIKEYTKGDLFTIQMSDDTVFEVSRRKKPEVLEKLKRML